MRTYQVITAAATYPVSLTETKLHLKVDIGTDDTLITNLIIAATELSEEYTNRFFIETIIKQTCSNFNELKELYKSPVISVTSVVYYDSNNAIQVLANTEYVVNNEFEPCQINLADTKSYPNITTRVDAVNSVYKVGYGASANDVPHTIKQAILLTIGNWYENRESIVVGRTFSELSQSAKWLLDTYKIQVVR
tara:strand:- start:356 stop:934 length:579 start_codon:yes stop_codon:yes gene_type:complete